MTINKTLFVYGTLTFPEVVHALTGKDFTSEEAKLENYTVKKIYDRPYPGLVKEDDSVADGVVLFDVDGETYELIKDWEDDEYMPSQVRAIVDGKEIEAYAFVYISDRITNQNWDKSEFKKKNLDNYLNVRIPGYLKSKAF